MKMVGMRELKNRLSAYLRYVGSRETVLVWIAERWSPNSQPSGKTSNEQSGTLGLFARSGNGLVTIGATNKPDIYPQLTPAIKRRSGAELLDHERADR
jgi:hypothetical protein